MKKSNVRLLSISLLASLVSTCAVNTSLAEEDRRPPREKWQLVTLRAKIQSIDLETRQAVLEGEPGQLMTVELSDEVKRIDEFQKGDVVKADYWEYISAEFREPTPEEKAQPLLILAEAGKAPANFPPGAALGAVVQAVVTVEHVSKALGEVTIRGPRGRYLTIPVKDKKLLDELKTGEVAVVTYAEALVLSLEKSKLGILGRPKFKQETR